MTSRKYITLLLAGVAAVPAMAQPSARHAAAFFRADRPAVVTGVLEAQASRNSSTTAEKPTALVQRMVAQVNHDSTSGTRDSFRYFYFSPARGAVHSPKNTTSYFPLEFSPFDIYDSASVYGGYRSQYVQFDSARRYDFSSSGTLMGSEMLVRNQYNAANRITQMEHYENGPATPTRRFMMAYNAAGDPVSKTFYENYQSTPLALLTTQTSVYNAQHRPVTDSNFSNAISNSPSSRYVYTYNAAGLLTEMVSQGWTGSAWQSSNRTNYVYNAAGLLHFSTSESYDMGVWTPDYKDSFVYAGTNPSFIAEYGYAWNIPSGTWKPSSRTFAHLNAAGNWDTVTSQYYDQQTSAWDFLSRVILTYNSYNNWETLTEAYDDNGNGVIDAGEVYGTNRYYYELWDNALAGLDALSPSSHITVSPNPAGDWLRVECKGQDKPKHFVLVDLGGRVVVSETFAPQSNGINLSGVMPGLYIFKAIRADGVVLHSEKVIRK